MATAFTELDFRLVTSFILFLAWSVGLDNYFVSFVKYAELGFPFTTPNILIAALLGFVDGFIDGFLIAWIYKYFSTKKDKSKNNFVLNLGSATGVVFGLSSFFLSLVTICYQFELQGYGYSFRPLNILFMLVDNFINQDDFRVLIQHYYFNFPKTYFQTIRWLLWGACDGFIGGIISGCIYNIFKKISLIGKKNE